MVSDSCLTETVPIECTTKRRLKFKTFEAFPRKPTIITNVSKTNDKTSTFSFEAEIVYEDNLSTDQSELEIGCHVVKNEINGIMISSLMNGRVYKYPIELAIDEFQVEVSVKNIIFERADKHPYHMEMFSNPCIKVD